MKKGDAPAAAETLGAAEIKVVEPANVTLEPTRTITSAQNTTAVNNQKSVTPKNDITSGPEQHGKVVTVKEFEIMAENALKTLPKQNPPEKITEEEAHHITADALAQIQPLADIAQAVADNPELRKNGFDFYEKCVDQSDLEHTTRALCLTHMRKLAPQLDKREQDELEFTKRRLASNQQDTDIQGYSDFEMTP